MSRGCGAGRGEAGAPETAAAASFVPRGLAGGGTKERREAGAGAVPGAGPAARSGSAPGGSTGGKSQTGLRCRRDGGRQGRGVEGAEKRLGLRLSLCAVQSRCPDGVPRSAAQSIPPGKARRRPLKQEGLEGVLQGLRPRSRPGSGSGHRQAAQGTPAGLILHCPLSNGGHSWQEQGDALGE